MIAIIKNQKGMNIVGQGGKIMLFTLPALIVAILLHIYLPKFAALPDALSFLKPIGYVLLGLGIILWASAVVQLLFGFSKGRLVTTGVYGIVRNPIYSSFAILVLPAITFLTLTWVYLIPAIFLYIGVNIFIKKEEKQLTKAFGKAYESYKARVPRMIMFLRD